MYIYTLACVCVCVCMCVYDVWGEGLLFYCVVDSVYIFFTFWLSFYRAEQKFVPMSTF